MQDQDVVRCSKKEGDHHDNSPKFKRVKESWVVEPELVVHWMN